MTPAGVSDVPLHAFPGRAVGRAAPPLLPHPPGGPSRPDPKGTAMPADVAFLLRAVIGRIRSEEAGFSTAELLGNAALGIAALVLIWGLLTNVGSSVMEFITNALGL